MCWQPYQGSLDDVDAAASAVLIKLYLGDNINKFGDLRDVRLLQRSSNVMEMKRVAGWLAYALRPSERPERSVVSHDPSSEPRERHVNKLSKQAVEHGSKRREGEEAVDSWANLSRSRPT